MIERSRVRVQAGAAEGFPETVISVTFLYVSGAFLLLLLVSVDVKHHVYLLTYLLLLLFLGQRSERHPYSSEILCVQHFVLLHAYHSYISIMPQCSPLVNADILHSCNTTFLVKGHGICIASWCIPPPPFIIIIIIIIIIIRKHSSVEDSL